MGEAFGHVAYSLSENDMKMVRSVPEGGNWRNIPLSIPSKRLEQIRASGGRTTLYGRLSWKAPSYTITTYFNRPGNGCYIHPEEDRVLTSLEAARLQSFPDTFKFSGPKTSKTKQIGNAVPPILGYAIGKKIREVHPSANNVVDLFAGAGGLSLGLHWAGFKTVVATDNNKDAIETFRVNNPRTKIVAGDITDPVVRAEVTSEARVFSKVDMIVGGPPCQGFSTAGLRMIDDPRNQLYKQFVQVVSELRPKIVIMENVAGLISSNKGKTFEDIKRNFTEIGYEVEGRKLLAAHYGVPQKRQRLILIATLGTNPSSLFPEPILDEDSFLTVRDAIGDLPSLPVLDSQEPVKPRAARSSYQFFMQNLISPDDYLNSLKGAR